MQIKIEIAENMKDLLEEEWGDLPKAAKEALAIESCRMGKISVGLLAEMLGMGVIEADGWLAGRGVPRDYSIEDLDADRRDLNTLFS